MSLSLRNTSLLKIGAILKPFATCPVDQQQPSAPKFRSLSSDFSSLSRGGNAARIYSHNAILFGIGGEFSRRNFANVSAPRFHPQTVAPRSQAAFIRARIPKKLTAHNVFVKENYEQAKKGAQKSTPEIFAGLIKEFKSLPPAKLVEYEAKARTTQEAHKAAVSTLTDEERAVLLADKRKRSLRKAILSAARKLEALKHQYAHPPSSTGAYALFCKDNSKNAEVGAAKTLGERSKILASMWKSLPEPDRQRYEKRSEESRRESRRALTEWRRKMADSGEQAALAVGRIDDLRAELRKLRRRLHKMEQSGSIDEELAEAEKPTKKKKLTKVTKKLTAKVSKRGATVATKAKKSGVAATRRKKTAAAAAPKKRRATKDKEESSDEE